MNKLSISTLANKKNKNNVNFETNFLLHDIFKTIINKEKLHFISESKNDNLELAVESINKVNSGGSRTKKPNKKKNTPNRKKNTNKIKAHKTYNKTKRKKIR
jgi:hypothetical protein